MGMCGLLLMSDVINKLCEYLKVERSDESRVIRAFEDNERTLKLADARLPKTTHHIKHVAALKLIGF